MAQQARPKQGPNFLNEPRVYTGHLSLFLYPSFFWRDRKKEKDAQYIPEIHSKSLGSGIVARGLTLFAAIGQPVGRYGPQLPGVELEQLAPVWVHGPRFLPSLH